MILDNQLNSKLFKLCEMVHNAPVNLKTILKRFFPKYIHFCGGSKFQVDTGKHKNLVYREAIRRYSCFYLIGGSAKREIRD